MRLAEPTAKRPDCPAKVDNKDIDNYRVFTSANLLIIGKIKDFSRFSFRFRPISLGEMPENNQRAQNIRKSRR
ncbi:hypothetical protein [Microvirga sp. P5_D2]